MWILVHQIHVKTTAFVWSPERLLCVHVSTDTQDHGARYVSDCPQTSSSKPSSLLGDLCTPNPCLNGGQCRPNGFGGFTCQCPSGYTGPRCEDRTSPVLCAHAATPPLFLFLRSRSLCWSALPEWSHLSADQRQLLPMHLPIWLHWLRLLNQSVSLETSPLSFVFFISRRCVHTESMLERWNMSIQRHWWLHLSVSTRIQWTAM